MTLPFRYLTAAALLTGLAFGFMTYLSPSFASTLPVETGLKPFVQFRPAVPIVFTSRTEPASFQAAANEGEGFQYPGTIPWHANEGRLRLLDQSGKVYELTWGRSLPDGTTLIDVMSPSISIDGTRILFAGRKSKPDAGHWRIYEMNLDGSGLKQLSGGPHDPGCISTPPLRYDANQQVMTDEARRKLDYDDVDPVDLGSGNFSFASSRIPDLGDGHSRRATQIWTWPNAAAAPFPISANRNNDRWPALLSSDYLVYSLWSRVRVGVTEDRTEVKPFTEGGKFVTQAFDGWMGARTTPNAADFGYAIKSNEPVWRPRPLFNGRIAFMTQLPGQPGRFRLAQADWGYLRTGPSTMAYGTGFPDQGNARLLIANDVDTEGNELSAGCPSAYPENSLLFAGSTTFENATTIGIYLTSDNWEDSTTQPRLLFDDPALVDAEPVAAYAREIRKTGSLTPPEATGRDVPNSLKLNSGKSYTGPMGYLENLAVLLAIRNPIPWKPADAPAGYDSLKNPLIPAPETSKKMVLFAANRDRFDDANQPRVRGKFERLIELGMDEDDTLQAWAPSDPLTPTVLAGFDADGKVTTWSGTAKDKDGKTSQYAALAADHFSGTRTNGFHYCNGCHTGHTFTGAETREKLAK
jgi:hypothetical protein